MAQNINSILVLQVCQSMQFLKTYVKAQRLLISNKGQRDLSFYGLSLLLDNCTITIIKVYCHFALNQDL